MTLSSKLTRSVRQAKASSTSETTDQAETETGAKSADPATEEPPQSEPKQAPAAGKPATAKKAATKGSSRRPASPNRDDDDAPRPPLPSRRPWPD
ncbi:MAG: hypothetical protein ACQERR_08750 [Pseudomonadota bacterium]